MKKEDEFIVTPDSFTQEQWCEMYIKVVECAQELKIETERLKELCNKYEEEHSTKFNEWVFDKRENESLAKDVDFWRTKYNEEFDEALSLTVYKSRCEKATDYLKQKMNIKENYMIYGDVANDLLNILTGGDKE